MTKSISSGQLKKIIKSEVSDQALKKRLSRLGSPPLDTLIREASVVLEDRLRSVSSLDEFDGVKLVDEAFKPGDKRLKFSENAGEQDGVRMLYRGAIQFIRNPPMHKLVDYPFDTARIFIRMIDSLLLLLRASMPISSGASPEREGSPKRRKGSQEYHKFFAELIERLNPEVPRMYRSPYAQSYYQISTGIAKIHYEWSFHRRPHHSFGVELHFEKGSRASNLEILTRIEPKIPDLENALQEHVVIQREWGKNWARLYVQKSEANPTEELKAWSVMKMATFIKTLQPVLDGLE